LRISPKTVEAHRSNMMKKLRTTNTPQLLKSSFELGFLR
jgi:DNA-binding CsgD family transcriptional regulator